MIDPISIPGLLGHPGCLFGTPDDPATHEQRRRAVDDRGDCDDAARAIGGLRSSFSTRQGETEGRHGVAESEAGLPVPQARGVGNFALASPRRLEITAATSSLGIARHVIVRGATSRLEVVPTQ